MDKKVIVIEQVSFSYEDQVILKDLSLTLNQGESYAVIGRSGTGKSTLLDLLAGFLKPDAGHIRIQGRAVEGPRPETAVLFQHLGLFPWQTVEQALAMPLKLMKEKDDINTKVIKLLKELGLEKLQDKYPSSLSGGERQRVALARTLIGQPDLLLMDEPSSALDAMTKETFQQLLLKWQQKQKATLVFVTHDIEEAVMLGQHILVMDQEGEISTLNNPYYRVKNPRDQIGFYDTCIQLRKMLHMEQLDEE